jgi:glycerate dehydrogenase
VKIVVLDGATVNPGDNPWDALAELGDLTVHDRSLPGEIIERARPAAVLLTNKTPLAADTLDQLPELRFISVLATGYDMVDAAAARRRGVPVANVPEYGTESVAQHTFALLLELCQQVGLHDAAVHAGEWSAARDFCFWKRPPVELAGATIGIVGYGRIGRRVAQVADAFRMQVIAGGRHGEPSSETLLLPSGRRASWAPIAEVFAAADVVSLHCSLDRENVRFVDGEMLARMKPSAYLINTARGALIDEQALTDALIAGRIAGAAVDVVSSEPMRPDNPLLRAPNMVITPHMAWGSRAARRRLLETTVENVKAFLAGNPVNIVNR